MIDKRFTDGYDLLRPMTRRVLVLDADCAREWHERKVDPLSAAIVIEEHRGDDGFTICHAIESPFWLVIYKQRLNYQWIAGEKGINVRPGGVWW